MTAMRNLAVKMGLEDQLIMGVYKISGVAKMSTSSIITLCLKQGWDIAEVIYVEQGSAVVLAESGPKNNKFGVMSGAGSTDVVRILAMNHTAKEHQNASLNQKAQKYVADGEGEEIPLQVVQNASERYQTAADKRKRARLEKRENQKKYVLPETSEAQPSSSKRTVRGSSMDTSS